MKIHIILLAFIVSLFAYHFYKKFRYYKVWWQMPRAFTIPFLGSLWFLLQMARDLTEFMTGVLDKNDSRITYWMGQSLVYMTARPQDWEKVVKRPDCLNKAAPLYDKFEKVLNQGIVISKDEHWKHNRKIMNRGFTKPLLDSYVSDMYKTSEKFVESLRKDFKPNDDILYYMYDYSMNTFIATFLGVDGEPANKVNRWAEIIKELNDLTFLRMSHPFYHVDYIFFKTKYGKQFVDAVGKLKDFLRTCVDASNKKLALNDPVENARMEELLFNKVKDTNILPANEYLDELSSLILAGTDTTSLSMSTIVILLGIFKEMQEEAYTEIMEVMGDREEITNQDLLEFKYLERFIYESLRMFPVVPVMGRELGADLDLGDVVLPAGTNFITFVFHIHRNPEFYPDPLRFDPDRFLPEECATRNPYTFLAFSNGARNCIGVKFAMLEMKIAIANLIRNFRITSSYKSLEEMETFTILFNKLKAGFRCTLHPR